MLAEFASSHRHAVVLRGLVAASLLILVAPATSLATDRYQPEPEKVLEGNAATPWERIERHRDPHPRFPTEPLPKKLEHFFPQVKNAFGSGAPHSSNFLLHVAPGWDQSSRPNPVLLLPGANDDASRRYSNPLSTQHPDFLKQGGLMQDLSGRGFSVFAISFSHYHGDNRLQGEHVGNAIRRIRRMLGRDGDADFKVDLVTFSKGAMAARCYVQSAGSWYADTRFLTKFRGDVRRVIFQCGPLGGLDMPFRYYLYNLTCAASDFPAPMGASHVMTYGFMRASGEKDILSGMWTGQLQMLNDLRDLGVPHGPLSFTVDANMSGSALVNGGRTMFLRSKGIQHAMEAGGNMIELMNQTGFPPEVEAAMLGGTRPVLEDERYPLLKIPAGFQIIAPNDGLLFLKSALLEDAITAQGARVLGTRTLPLNHVELSRDQRAFDFVEEMLTIH